MKKNRPVNLAIQTMALPLTAYASILHRISGVIIWFGLVLCIPTLYFMLQSQENFIQAKDFLVENFLVQFVVWGLLTALGYYCLATLKHFIQEFGYFEDLAGGIAISKVTIGLALVFSALFGGWIWL